MRRLFFVRQSVACLFPPKKRLFTFQTPNVIEARLWFVSPALTLGLCWGQVLMQDSPASHDQSHAHYHFLLGHQPKSFKRKQFRKPSLVSTTMGSKLKSKKQPMPLASQIGTSTIVIIGPSIKPPIQNISPNLSRSPPASIWGNLSSLTCNQHEKNGASNCRAQTVEKKQVRALYTSNLP